MLEREEEASRAAGNLRYLIQSHEMGGRDLRLLSMGVDGLGKRIGVLLGRWGRGRFGF